MVYSIKYEPASVNDSASTVTSLKSTWESGDIAPLVLNL